MFNGKGSNSHAHSSAARKILDAYYVGDLQSCSGSLAHTPAHPGVLPSALAIDENKPLLRQVSSLGSGYMDWVHRPISGQPRFFESDWAEAVTKVQWWVVPLVWLPLVAYSFFLAGASETRRAVIVCMAVVGLIAWQLMEYSLHRFLFHKSPNNSVGIFLHFLLHGCHHKYPMDTERLVFPPIPASWVIGAVYGTLHMVAPTPVALAIFGGMLLGYVSYDCLHYFMHSGLLGGPLKASHMRHHYMNPTAGYGISSPLFDWMLGTL